MRFFLLVCCVLLQLMLRPSAEAALFGPENRKEISTSLREYELSRSVAVAVLTTLAEPQDKSNYVLTPDKLNLCTDQAFANDPVLPYSCTGFLVGADLLVTAGHCMYPQDKELIDQTEGACKIYRWIFDYHNDEHGESPRLVAAKNVYHCKKILYAVEDSKSPWRDYALIQLDRKVSERKALPLSQAVALNDHVFMIGHPFGSTSKLAPNAWVIRNDVKNLNFVTNLNAFDGNSGSPVFDKKHHVIGILVSGTPSNSLVENSSKKCLVYNHCDANGKHCLVEDTSTSGFPDFQTVGSDVQRVDGVAKLLSHIQLSEK